MAVVVLALGCALVIAGPSKVDQSSFAMIFGANPDCDSPGLQNAHCPDAAGQTCPASQQYQKCKAKMAGSNTLDCAPGGSSILGCDVNSQCAPLNPDSGTTKCNAT